MPLYHRVFGGLLQIAVDGEHQVASRGGSHILQELLGAAGGIDLDRPVPVGAPEEGVIVALDPVLADGRPRLQSRELLLVEVVLRHLADVAQDVRGQSSERILPQERGLHLHSRILEAMLLDRGHDRVLRRRPP